ncbi:MAG TPA: hypothetical protein VGQ83_27685 [Polyangia bacterium]|jgi:hypothetical protein
MAAPRLARLALVVGAAALLAGHILLFNFVTDDAYISFRYARNLAQHGQLVFNLGERVEGFTNFLWTVTLAGCMKLGARPEVSSRVLGALLALGGLLLTLRLGAALHGGRRTPWDAVAPLLLAATGGYAAWASGGLETQMFTFCFLAGVALYLEDHLRGRDPLLAAVPFALAALTRPEGSFLFALTLLHRGLCDLRARRFRPSRRELAFGGLFLLIVVPYFAWRWRYYGWPFPNTFYIKSSGGPGTVDRGLYYLWRFVVDHELLVLLPLVVVGWPRRDERGGRVLLGYAALIVAPFFVYVAKVGGDFMGLYRFLVPLTPLLALVAQEALRRAAERAAPHAGRPAAALAVAAVVALFAASSFGASLRSLRTIGADRGIDTVGYLKKFADDRALVGKWFATVLRPDDSMTVGGAGAQPYYAGNVPTLDAFGLTNAYIAHWVPAVTDRPGHQKFACNEYVVENRPCPGTKKDAPPPPPRPRPTVVCHTYRLGEYGPYHPPPGDAAYWRNQGYEWVSARIPGLNPPYYSFLKRLDRELGPFPARTGAPPPRAAAPEP